MTGKIPHNALVVVADGTGARFFRNGGHGSKISLSAEGEFNPTDLLDEGPAGKRPPESSNQETDEATFAKQLAKELYRRAHMTLASQPAMAPMMIQARTDSEASMGNPGWKQPRNCAARDKLRSSLDDGTVLPLES